MSGDDRDRVERLRGSLEAEEPGARGLERVARNPACTQLRAITLVGITPATALEKVYGEAPEEGQSLFAIFQGNSFEKRLYENGAQRLLAQYREAGRLGSLETKVVVGSGKITALSSLRAPVLPHQAATSTVRSRRS